LVFVLAFAFVLAGLFFLEALDTRGKGSAEGLGAPALAESADHSLTAIITTKPIEKTKTKKPITKDMDTPRKRPEDGLYIPILEQINIANGVLDWQGISHYSLFSSISIGLLEVSS
jgi:hypothetical protein